MELKNKVLLITLGKGYVKGDQRDDAQHQRWYYKILQHKQRLSTNEYFVSYFREKVVLDPIVILDFGSHRLVGQQGPFIVFGIVFQRGRFIHQCVI